MDVLDSIVALAHAHRTARIFYQKLHQKQSTQRTIEPYHFLSHGSVLMLMSWQVDPCVGEPCWRNFRADRIMDVSDGGGVFRPRRNISICDGEVQEFAEFCKHKKHDPIDNYRRYMLKAIGDGKLTEQERIEAGNLAHQLDTKQLKLVHAQIFQEALFDVLLDHQITDEEDEFLSKLREFMDEIGWSP